MVNGFTRLLAILSTLFTLSCGQQGRIQSYSTGITEETFCGLHLGTTTDQVNRRVKQSWDGAPNPVLSDEPVTTWSVSKAPLIDHRGVTVFTYYERKLSSVSMIYTTSWSDARVTERLLWDWLDSVGKPRTEPVPIADKDIRNPLAWCARDEVIYELFRFHIEKDEVAFIAQASHIGLERLLGEAMRRTQRSRWASVEKVLEERGATMGISP